MANNCASLKQSVTAFLASNTVVSTVGKSCIITLPVQTLDGRWVDVFVEERMNSALLIHDNGKAVAELFCQGLSITKRVHNQLGALAERYHLHYDSSNDRFEVLCKPNEAESAIMRVGACTAVASSSLLDLGLDSIQDLSALLSVKGFLKQWKKDHPGVKLFEKSKFGGAIKQHVFDFSLSGPGQVLAIDVLSPSVSAINAAERFGFKVRDLRDAKVKLKVVAIRTDADHWSKDARRVVEEYADMAFTLPKSQKLLPDVSHSLSELIAGRLTA